MNFRIVHKDGVPKVAVTNFNNDITTYEVSYSWNNNVDTFDFYHNLESEEINLLVKQWNLFEDIQNYSEMIYEIPELMERVFDYITFTFNYKNGKQEKHNIFHSDIYPYEKFRSEYFLDTEYRLINLEEYNDVIVGIKGNYGDLWQCEITRAEDKKIHIKIPDDKYMISTSYDFLIYKNKSQIKRDGFKWHPRKKIEFSLVPSDYGQYTKYSLRGKAKYHCVNKVDIYENGRKLNINTSKLINSEFFIKRGSDFLNREFKIAYSYQENIENSNIIHEDIFINTPSTPKRIFDIARKFDFTKKEVVINWKSEGFDNENTFIIRMDGNVIGRTKENHFSIPSIDKKSNGKNFFDVKIFAENNFLTTKKEVGDIKIENYIVLDSVSYFKPTIDTSDCLYNTKSVGRLSWTSPGWEASFRVKLSGLANDRFLDELAKPWVKELVLNKAPSEFDKRYKDYEEEVVYDFRNGVANLSKINDGPSSYTFEKNQLVYQGGANYTFIPLTLTKVDEEYEVVVEVLDRFGTIIGDSSKKFKILDEDLPEILDNELHIDRGQTFQFGESGTVGEFYKIQNPTPADSLLNYSPLNKVYGHKALYDLTNIDKEGNSLHYYFTKNPSEIEREFTIKFNRNNNFHIFSWKIEGVNEWQKVVPLGNEFDDNIIKIDRMLFAEDGVYTMKLQTTSASGKKSEIKEIKFFVYSAKPEKPQVKINEADLYDNAEKLSINKKYFEMSILNNKPSSIYAGWEYKEAHFFFRTTENNYNDYPDYVVRPTLEDGEMSFKNTISIENGEYFCKVVAYDYAGNASDPEEFEFNLTSEMKVTPHEYFINEPNQTNKYTIKKAQDSEGLFYHFRYTSDGINYKTTAPVKVESPYYINDNLTNEEITLELNFVKENGEYIEAEYFLRVYEFNKKHPDGQPQYWFENEKEVSVRRRAAVSKPIFSLPAEKTVAVFEERKSNEWSYCKNLDDLVFETTHDNLNGVEYSLEVINPSNTRSYTCKLTTPDKLGIFSFDKIKTKCNIDSDEEGVWEIRYIRTDEYGMSNQDAGYYTYFVNLITRLPFISSLIHLTNNSYNIYGIQSEEVGFFVNTDSIYTDISNYNSHKEKFIVNKFNVDFVSKPDGGNSKIVASKDNKSAILVMNNLTIDDKTTHSKDGSYSVIITAEDPLTRLSVENGKDFSIDTIMDAEIIFLNSSNYSTLTPTILCSADEQVERVYYKTISDDEEDVAPQYMPGEWPSKSPIYNTDGQYNGITFDNLTYEKEGYKNLYYVIEEKSGNVSNVQKRRFKIDLTTRNVPIFDYNNKIYYSLEHSEFSFSWKSTNKDIKEFSFRLEKINVNNDGEITVLNTYAISLENPNLMVKVGPNEAPFIDIGEEREIKIPILTNTIFETGVYRLNLKSFSVYGEPGENNFIFQYDSEANEEIVLLGNSNKVTLESNMISWQPISKALYYEVSYDNVTWTKTTDNKFFINRNEMIKSQNEESFFYIRWRNKNGSRSEPIQVKITMDVSPVETPSVTSLEGKVITDNNRTLGWKVNFKDPSKVYGFYYSFDKENWTFKTVNKSETIINYISDFEILADGIYDVYVQAFSENPLVHKESNKTKVIHSSVKVFASKLPYPEFVDIEKGKDYFEDKRLYLSNKVDGVSYQIYLNGRTVPEGYCLSSSITKKHVITVSARKNGINTKIDLIKPEDDFYITTCSVSPYALDIGNSKVLCEVNEDTKEIFVRSMPSTKNTQIILYSEKGLNAWKTLRIGDSLSLVKEWEFHISNFSVV